MWLFWILTSTSLAFLCFTSVVAVADESEISKPQNIESWPLEKVYEYGDGLYETVVVAHRPSLSAGAVTVSQEEIKRTHPSSADEVLRLVPGVNIVQHGSEGKGHQLLLRGFDAAHGSDVEVLLLGVRINEPSHVHGPGYLDLYGIIPEVVLNIEVNKGPFLPGQGNFATAGSVRFELGVSSELQPGLVRTETSHRGQLRGVAVAAPHPGEKETFFAAEAVYDRGFGANREARRSALLAEYVLNINAKDALTAFASGQAARFETPGALRLSDVLGGRIDFHGSYGPAGEGLSDRILGRLGFEHDNENTNLEVFVYGLLRRFSLEENFTGWLLHETTGDRKRQQQQGSAWGAEIELERKLPTPFSSVLLSGAGWRFDNIYQAEAQVDQQGRPWQTNRELEARIQHLHLYGGVRFSPWPWLEMMPSIRGDLFYYDVRDRLGDRRGDDTYFSVSPRLAASFPIHERLTLFADYGRGFRSPEARAVVAPTGTGEDETLSRYNGGDPEIAVCDTVEVGIDFQPLEIATFKLVGFSTWLEREVVFDHVSNLNLELDGTRRQGIEAEARFNPAIWMTGSATFTWVDARFTRSGDPVPNTPSWIRTARLFFGKSRGPHGGTQLLWIGKRNLAHGATADGYVKLDMDAGWRFERFEVAIIVTNAFNVDIMEGTYHYASWFDKNEQRSVLPKIHYVAGEPLTVRAVFTAFL